MTTIVIIYRSRSETYYIMDPIIIQIRLKSVF